MENKTLITVQQYAQKNKLSIYSVVKKINSGELKSLKKEGKEYIILDDEKPEIKKASTMRRSEFHITDKELFTSLLKKCEYGTLCLFDDTYPYNIPLNFALLEDEIIFHGSNEGKKVELIEQNPNASFSVVQPYSFIPSYFSNSSSACPATQFFASVMIQGKVTAIQNPSQKAKALEALMQKMQPQKRYEDIDETNPIYTKMLQATAVFSLHVKSSSMKLKVGQNLSQTQKENLISQLEQRGNELDLQTIELIKKYS